MSDHLRPIVRRILAGESVSRQEIDDELCRRLLERIEYWENSAHDPKACKDKNCPHGTEAHVNALHKHLVYIAGRPKL